MIYDGFNITIDRSKSSDQLLDAWRHAEIQKRFWSQRNPERNLIAEKQLHNYSLVMQKVWDELTNRADSSISIHALLLLIETGASFTMNLNPKS